MVESVRTCNVVGVNATPLSLKESWPFIFELGSSQSISSESEESLDVDGESWASFELLSKVMSLRLLKLEKFHIALLYVIEHKLMLKYFKHTI